MSCLRLAQAYRMWNTTTADYTRRAHHLLHAWSAHLRFAVKRWYIVIAIQEQLESASNMGSKHSEKQIMARMFHRMRIEAHGSLSITSKRIEATRWQLLQAFLRWEKNWQSNSHAAAQTWIGDTHWQQHKKRVSYNTWKCVAEEQTHQTQALLVVMLMTHHLAHAFSFWYAAVKNSAQKMTQICRAVGWQHVGQLKLSFQKWFSWAVHAVEYCNLVDTTIKNQHHIKRLGMFRLWYDMTISRSAAKLVLQKSAVAWHHSSLSRAWKSWCILTCSSKAWSQYDSWMSHMLVSCRRSTLLGLKSAWENGHRMASSSTGMQSLALQRLCIFQQHIQANQVASEVLRKVVLSLMLAFAHWRSEVTALDRLHYQKHLAFARLQILLSDSECSSLSLSHAFSKWATDTQFWVDWRYRSFVCATVAAQNSHRIRQKSILAYSFITLRAYTSEQRVVCRAGLQKSLVCREYSIKEKRLQQSHSLSNKRCGFYNWVISIWTGRFFALNQQFNLCQTALADLEIDVKRLENENAELFEENRLQETRSKVLQASYEKISEENERLRQKIQSFIGGDAKPHKFQPQEQMFSSISPLPVQSTHDGTAGPTVWNDVVQEVQALTMGERTQGSPH